MRSAGLVALAVLVSTAPARADDVDALIAEGQELAKKGEFEPAIDRFKRADRITPKASHACMIGLTYLRLQILPRAELFLARCRKRATASDPLPMWMLDAERQLAEQLVAAKMLAIELRVLPAEATPTVTVSTFGADESFEPQAFHLGGGTHVIKVTAPGFEPVDQSIEVMAGGTRQIEVILERPAVVQPVTPVLVAPLVATPPVVIATDHTWSNRLLVGAGVAAAGGVVLHVLAFQTRKKLDAAASLEIYRDHETTFDIERAATFSLYGVAAIAGGIGLYLRLTGREIPVQVSADVRSGGAFVTIGWQR